MNFLIYFHLVQLLIELTVLLLLIFLKEYCFHYSSVFFFYLLFSFNCQSQLKNLQLNYHSFKNFLRNMMSVNTVSSELKIFVNNFFLFD